MLKGRVAQPATFLVLGLLLFFRLALPSALTISDEISPFFKTFPMQIGPWSGTDTPPDERTLEILETRNVLSRQYENESGDQVHLLLVSSQQDRRVAHPPEVCYIGSNFNIVQERQSELTLESLTVPVKQFEAVPERHPDRSQEVAYLYRVGDRFTTSYFAQQIQFAMDRLTQGDSEVLLIRVAGADEEAVTAFLKDLMPLLKEPVARAS